MIKALHVLAAVLTLAFASVASAQTSVEDAEGGIVRVVVIAETSEGRMLYGSGSGFVIAPNLIVTAAHVVAPARQNPAYSVAIVPPEGSGLVPATIVRYSPLNELALIEVRGDIALPTLTISTLDPEIGDSVIALGYPDVDYQGVSGSDLLRPSPPSRTSGEIVLLRDRAPTGDPIPTINHQAVISSGSSGGPLLDECGRVLGVNAWHVSGVDTGETRGIATRALQLLDFLDQAGVTATLSDERCVTRAERADAESAETLRALRDQNDELEEKLASADRLMRVAVITLIAGAGALLIAILAFGAMLLSRRRASATQAPDVSQPQPFEAKRGRALNPLVIAGVLIVALLIALALSAWF